MLAKALAACRRFDGRTGRAWSSPAGGPCKTDRRDGVWWAGRAHSDIASAGHRPLRMDGRPFVRGRECRVWHVAWSRVNAACDLLRLSRCRVVGCAIVGGLGFAVPAVVMVLALSVSFLASAPPKWVIGVGAGAGAARPSPIGANVGPGASLPIRANYPKSGRYGDVRATGAPQYCRCSVRLMGWGDNDRRAREPSSTRSR